MPTTQPQESQLIAAGVIKDYNKLSGDRGNWESHWQEIAERIYPAQSRLFMGQFQSQTQGDKRNEYVYDSTGMIALQRFGAILDSLLTPRNQTWHRVTVSDKTLQKDRETRLFFEEMNKVLFRYRYAPLANFASQNQMNYKMLGAYGNGCVFIDPLKNFKRQDDGVRYRMCHLSGVYFRENHQGIVDTAYRYFKQKARESMQEDYAEELPDSIKDAAKTSPDREFAFIHCVKPRSDYDPQRTDLKGMPYASYYVSIEAQFLLQEKGHDTFPYAISRYEQNPGEVYARSPAMDALPAIKTLNEQKKAVLKQGQRATDPVVLIADDGIIDAWSFKPGTLVGGAVTPDGRPLAVPFPVGNVQAGREMMNDERAIINDAFLVTLFQILVETPQMTATEVLERTREKGILLAPTIGRQQSEYLGTMIEREIDVLQKQKKLPEYPQALLEAKGEYTIEYESPLSRSARAEEAAGALRSIEMALNVAAQSQNPALLDHFNWDVIVPETSDINGMPASWRNDPKTIQMIREGRNAQQEQQTAMQAAPGAAAMIKSTAAARQMDRS